MKARILILFLTLAFFPLTGEAIENTPADGSGTITTGGTSQVIFAANPNRRYLEIQNVSDETMYINFGSAASASSASYMIAANGGAYINASNYCPTTTITIISATTGKRFVAKQGG